MSKRPPRKPLSKAPLSPQRPVTMADVAARVGVSKMTVSRALNHTGGSARSTSAALRQRILQTCQEMGYVIDQTARTFSTKRSGIVAALIPALNNSNFSDTAHGLTAALEGSGLQVLLGYTDYDVEAEERLLRAMLARRPEGLVLTGGSHTPAARELVKAASVPVIETWDLLNEPIEHTVGFSNAEAVADLVRQLYAKGYRRMAFLGGVPESDARGADRRHGWEQAMRELGLDPKRTLSVGEAPVSMAHGAGPTRTRWFACPTTLPLAHWPNASGAAGRCPQSWPSPASAALRSARRAIPSSPRWRWIAPVSAEQPASCCCVQSMPRAADDDCRRRQ